MINLFYIDLELKNNINGVTAYRNSIIPYLENNTNINLQYIILSDKFTTPKIEYQSLAKVYKLPISNFSKLLSDNVDLKSISFLINEIKHYENIVLHFNWINLCNLASLIKRQVDCKTILITHCIPWKESISSDYKLFHALSAAFIKGKPVKIINKQLQYEIGSYSNIDHFITVTDCAKKSLSQLFKIEDQKITKVSNGLNPSQVMPKYNGNKIKLRKHYRFDVSEKLIIYAGNISLRKGIFDIVNSLDQLLKKHPNIRLLIAGEGDYGEVMKLSKNNWSRITLCGCLDKQTLYDFYAMSDVGLVPSYIEQCSYTCIEMMHSGLPLLVSNVDGLKEMVNDDCGLRIKVDFKKDKAELNQKDLIEKVSFLLDHPEKAKKLGNNAKKYASEYFTAEKMAIETVAVYEQFLELAKIKESKKQGTTPIVSLLIPCHNAEKHLQDCLNSIYRQTFTNFELILINDGSTDETRKIIKTQKDTRIVLIDNTQNLGVAASLNKGINLAKGKYIARMDADDVMHQDRLQSQIDFLEANVSYGLVGSWQNITDIIGVPIKRIEPPEDNDDIKLGMLFYNPISHPTVMMRSELIKANPYDLDFNRCEDYELWFRLATKTKIKNLPKALINYRIHSDNTIALHQKEMQQNVMELLSSELEKLGIEHTPQELMLHCAIGFGMGKKFFNSLERIQALNNWLDKVFSASAISTIYSSTKVKKFRKHLVEECCEL